MMTLGENFIMKQYLALIILAMSVLLAACAPSTPTPPPFNRYTGQNVIDALNAAGAQVQSPVQDRVVGRGAPNTFIDRYLFAHPRIAPDGGQIVIFDTPEALKTWEDFIASLRNDPDTRRDVIYVYIKDNVLLQLSANLTPAEASAYENALMAMQ
jgi:hypothetical protein